MDIVGLGMPPGPTDFFDPENRTFLEESRFSCGIWQGHPNQRRMIAIDLSTSRIGHVLVLNIHFVWIAWSQPSILCHWLVSKPTSFFALNTDLLGLLLSLKP
jgi:hypothetical protein